MQIKQYFRTVYKQLLKEFNFFNKLRIKDQFCQKQENATCSNKTRTQRHSPSLDTTEERFLGTNLCRPPK